MTLTRKGNFKDTLLQKFFLVSFPVSQISGGMFSYIVVKEVLKLL